MAKQRRGTANCGLSLMGFDFWATIDFTFAPGRPSTWCRSIGTWDPPEPPEFEAQSIMLQLDEPGKLGPKWELTGKMFEEIAEHPRVLDALWESEIWETEF